MKKRKLKPAVKKTIVLTSILLFITVFMYSLSKNNNGSDLALKDYVYVNDYIFDNYVPVVNQEEKIIKPYTSDKVTIFKNFYDSEADEETQKKSIVYHDGIYMQNSGVDYSSEETFDVVSILTGTVSNITDDTLLGKSVEVRVSTDLVVMYQSLSEVNVKKGDTISQGDIIGKSGSCSLNSEVKQGLHIEIYKNGSVVNPEKYYNKTIKELTK